MHSSIKTVLFLATGALVGYGGAKAYVAVRGQTIRRGFDHYEGPSVQTGVGEAPGNHGFIAAGVSAGELEGLVDTWRGYHATSVGLEYGQGMDRAMLVAAAKVIHSRGMSVVLLPPGAESGRAWSAENPYKKPLTEIGADAEAAGIDFLCMSWLNRPPEPAYWQGQAEALRLVFSGKLILAADAADVQRIDCPEAAEIFGAIGPIDIPRRLPGAPAQVTLNDERVAWNCSLTQLESYVKKYDKKLALLHMSVPARVTSRLPEPGTVVKPAKDPALQGMIYEALLRETKGRAKTTDILLFDWAAGEQGDAPNAAAGVMEKLAGVWGGR